MIHDQTPTGQSEATSLRWYAIKVFYNRVLELRDYIAPQISDSYIPMVTRVEERAGVRRRVRRQLISSLLFVRTTPGNAATIMDTTRDRAMVYAREEDGQRIPDPIPDRQMDLFKLVTSHGEQGVDYLGADHPRYYKGDLVKVIDGPFKGSEGHIVRIKENRRLVVTVRGVCAIATGFIPGAFLRKVSPPG